MISIYKEYQKKETNKLRKVILRQEIQNTRNNQTKKENKKDG